MQIFTSFVAVKEADPQIVHLVFSDNQPNAEKPKDPFLLIANGRNEMLFSYNTVFVMITILSLPMFKRLDKFSSIFHKIELTLTI
jgi:hypothetical protein